MNRPLNRHILRLLIVVFVLFSSLQLPLQAEDISPSKIVVLDFDSVGVPDVTAIFLTDKLREHLLASGEYIIVSKDAVVEAAKKKELDIDDCFDDACVSLLGETAAVSKVLWGTLSKSGANFLLTLRMVDVKSRKVSSMVTQECVCSEELLPMLVLGAAKELLAAEEAALANQELYKEVPKLSVALIDLQDLGVSDVTAYSLSDVVRSQLFSHGFIDIVDRSTMLKTLKDNQFSLADCFSPACAVKVGKLLGVEKVVLGTFGQLGIKYSLSLKMVDSKSGEIVGAVSKDFYAKLEELPKYVKFLTDLLVERDSSAESAAVKIFSPVKSRVYLEGELKGEIETASSPLIITDIKPGIYNIKIDRIDNTGENGSVILKAGETLSFPESEDIAPEFRHEGGALRLSSSALAIISHPTGAAVFLNGIYRGITPLLLTDLPPQFYEVKLLHKRHKEAIDYLFVDENRLTTLEKFLRPGEQILFVSDRDGNREIYRIDYDGENLTRLTFKKGEDYSPAWAPDGSGFVFISKRGSAIKSNLYYSKINSSQAIPLTKEFDQVYSPSFAPNGTDIVFVGELEGIRKLYVVDNNGENLRLFKELAHEVIMPRWSPAGNLIAFIAGIKGSSEIFLLDLKTMKTRQLTDSFNTWDGYPAWRADGKKIAYIAKSYTQDFDDLVIVDVNKGSQTVILDELDVANSHPSWSADGRQLVYASVDASGNSDLYVINSDGSNKVRLTNHIAYDGEPAWLPPEPQAKKVIPTAERPLGKVKTFRKFARATVIIESEPPGAEVYIDGIKFNGVTPLTINDLKYGLHNVVLMTEKYVKWGMIDVREGDNIFEFSLNKKKSVIEVISEPQGVTVYADGRKMGSAPLIFSVMWGLHNFRFKKSGFKTKELAFYVEPSMMNKIKMFLDKE